MVEETKQAETVEQTETAGAEAAGTQQTEEQGQVQDSLEESQTPPESEIPDKVEPEDKPVPSYRLREETERRKALEAELAQIKGSLEKPKKQYSREELDLMFQDAVDKYGYATAISMMNHQQAEQIAEKKVAPLVGLLANQQIDANINSLKSLKEFSAIGEYSSEIKKRLDVHPFDVKVNPDSVKYIYYQIIGEKAAKGEIQKKVEKDTKERIEKDRKILGDTAVGDSKGGAGGIQGLTKEQEEERIAKDMSLEGYKSTLKYLQDKDKKNNKQPRTKLTG